LSQNLLSKVPRAGSNANITSFKTNKDRNTSCPELIKVPGGIEKSEENYYRNREEFPNYQKSNSLVLRSTGHISNPKSQGKNHQSNPNTSFLFRPKRSAYASSTEPAAGNIQRIACSVFSAELDKLISEFKLRFQNYNYRRFY